METGPITMIDAHTHAQPSIAATTAFMANLGLPMGAEGTVTDLVASMDRNDIAWTMIVPWLPAQDFVAEKIADGADQDTATADVIQQWHELNTWAAGAATQAPDRLKCVVGLDPVLMTADYITAEVATQLAAGASGLKVAPMFIGVPADDEAMEIVWQLAVHYDVPVLAECGGIVYPGHGGPWGHPRFFQNVLRSYPTLRLQLAHLGQGAEDDMIALAEQSNNFITDTALRLGGMDASGASASDLAAVLQLIRRIGTDHVAFGTNYPIVDQGEYARVLRSLGLTDQELRAVGHDNAARIWR